MRNLSRVCLIGAAAALLPAMTAVAKAPKGGGSGSSVPSYGVGTESFVSTVGPGGVPAGNGQPAIGSTTPVTAGTLSTSILPNGDVQVSLVQGFNDNTYGTNTDPLWGSKTHTFKDLLGSDKAEFKFADGAGNVVLDFDVDYIGQVKTTGPVQIAPNVTATYGSGYGTLGVLGGDGKVISGDAGFIKSLDTTFSDDLNAPEFVNDKSVLTNSSTSPNWNKVNGYTVVISGAAFGSNGFGSVSIPAIHDSPARPFSAPSVPLPPTVYGAAAMCGALFLMKKRRSAAIA